MPQVTRTMQLDSPSMLAVISLGQGAMLWCALAALLPVVIHFWNRHRFEVVPWAAMQYLAAAIRRHSRRLRLERWLLLAIRSLILLLLAVALADPVISPLAGLGPSRQGNQPTHFVLVIDGSYSMLASKDGQTRFQTAIEQAQQWIDTAHQGDGFTVVMMGKPPEVIIGQPAFDRADVRGEIEVLRPTHAAAQITSTLVEVEQLIARVGQKHPEFSQVQVGIFSDLEQDSWQPVGTAPCRLVIERLAEQASLVLFDVGQDSASNVAVVRLEQLQAATRSGVPARWEGVIENFAARPQANLAADWSVDGQLVQHQLLSLAPLETRSLQLEYTFTAPGLHHVELSISGDDLEADNDRWQVSQLREAIQVLCVEGRPGEADLLELALDPSGEASSIRIQKVTIGGLVDQSLEQYQLVCLANVARFSRDEANLLASYVAEGGSVVFFLGDQVQAENYNQLLGVRGADSLLPGPLAAIAPVGRYQLDPLAYRHPLVSVFRGQQRAGLLSTPVNSYQQIELPGGERGAGPQRQLADHWEVALALDNGDPLVIDGQVGEGEVFVFTTAISSLSRIQDGEQSIAWSELGSWPSFLPMVQEMVVLAVSRDQVQKNVVVGDLLRGQLAEGTSRLDVEIVLPRGDVQRLAVQDVDGRLRWAFGETPWGGLYEVRNDGESSAIDLFAVNLDSRESALLRIPEGELPAALQQQVVHLDKPSLLDTGTPARPLFQWLLGTILVLLLCESWIGHRPGRGSL
jgi:hypothetical protein